MMAEAEPPASTCRHGGTVRAASSKASRPGTETNKHRNRMDRRQRRGSERPKAESGKSARRPRSAADRSRKRANMCAGYTAPALPRKLTS